MVYLFSLITGGSSFTGGGCCSFGLVVRVVVRVLVVVVVFLMVEEAGLFFSFAFVLVSFVAADLLTAVVR